MYQIQITIDEKYTGRVNAELLESAITTTLESDNAQPGEIGVLITGDEKLAELNNTFRGIPSPTDVLSFPSGDSPVIPGLPHYYGDIAISVDRAAEQAAENDHSLEDELLLLIVHGTLHLLGYDHGTEEEETCMWEKQNAILAKLSKTD